MTLPLRGTGLVRTAEPGRMRFTNLNIGEKFIVTPDTIDSISLSSAHLLTKSSNTSARDRVTGSVYQGIDPNVSVILIKTKSRYKTQ
jgi:hypothetical protein